MKEIIISGTNYREKLAAAIKEAEGRATARTITADNITEALQHVGTRLGISKAAMDGITVTIDCNANDFPSSYKYTPQSTIFSAAYKRGSWRVTDIYRGKTHRFNNACFVQMTDACRNAILDRFSHISTVKLNHPTW